jgi:hypothetical protein
VNATPPGCPTASTSAFSVHRQRVKQAVGVCQRGAPDDRDRRLRLRELAREAFDPRGRHPSDPLDLSWRVLRKAFEPASDLSAGRSSVEPGAQPLSDDDVSQS